jgi:hypothetical protein
VLDSVAANASPAAVHERVERVLAAHLSPRTAALAVKIAARSWVRVEPETLRPAQLLTLVHGLLPILSTLVGEERARALTERVLDEVSR